MNRRVASETAPPLALESANQARWPKALQAIVLTVVFGLGFWQFAQAGYNWRAVLQGGDPSLFFAAMATLPVFGFPISACYIYAGVAFDPWLAATLCLGALAVNMSVSFALTRGFLKQPIARALQRRNWKLPRLQGENSFRFAFLVRTVPGPPFFVQNLALGLSGMSFWSYLGISLATQGSIALGMIYCSSVLSKEPGSVGGILALVVVGALVAIKTLRWIFAGRRSRSPAASACEIDAREKA